MIKKDAVKQFVERDFNSVPQEWVRKVAESEGEYPTLPMWGTMWIVDSWLGEKLLENSRVMVPDTGDIDMDALDEEERAKIQKDVDDGQLDELYDKYVDEEMPYEHCVLDKDGNPTSMFIYEIADEYVVGINGAGWNFYEGVWDKIYDMLELKWHTEE